MLAYSGSVHYDVRDMDAKIIINQKGVNRVQGGHPWVFRSDILEATEVNSGDVVPVYQPKGKFLGQAFYNPRSQISLRFISRRQEPIDRFFWYHRIKKSIEGRIPYGKGQDAYRVIYGESDLLPSLIVDKYKDVLVFQTLSLGMERFKEIILSILEELICPRAIVERNDVTVRELEGMILQSGIVRGELPPSLEIREGNYFFEVDPLQGQKTGLFLDQSENHQVVGRYSQGRVLDLFSYQGGFALPVSAKAEEVIAVDSSPPALERLKKNCERNQIKNVRALEENGFDFLRRCHEQKELFDMIILDPPPFIRNRKNIGGGVRGYKEINLRAMKILKPGGLLVTCSCSKNFTPRLFDEVLQEASRDAKRDIQILEQRGASSDHPVLLSFPESAYLQCRLLRIL